MLYIQVKQIAPYHAEKGLLNYQFALLTTKIVERLYRQSDHCGFEYTSSRRRMSS